ncbi:nucleoside 2-deoxyribosyltransferase [Aminobacter carboxidus]|uniref:Nucleoside 2-deoxyribosyltransferase n=1 Tax=Aminobacter carboxidus TaxID=376165 RepID=A0ABR9GYG5_9HYPH|nr:nucleoside 2-deoxyribosyltransferase [Aminobacter carboxidus]MBE1208598.1 nucleoside 2-deoxyribosyltransferase [Aminobacter carboxidus]
MKVYLAGPEVFLPNAREVLDRKIALTRRYGFTPISPGDLEVPATDTKRSKGVAISSINERLMMSSDMIIANLTPFRGVAADVGTAFELGFMCARGCPAYAFSNTSSSHFDRVARSYDGHVYTDAQNRPRGPDGLAVEDFDMVDNLMLDGGIEARGGAIITREVEAAELFLDHQAFEECLNIAATRFLR